MSSSLILSGTHSRYVAISPRKLSTWLVPKVEGSRPCGQCEPTDNGVVLGHVIVAGKTSIVAHISSAVLNLAALKS